jgi:uncharacterized protein
MTNIDEQPAGFFCWVELATTDQNGAKAFYSSLFGWTVDDNPMGPDDFYTIFKLSGKETAAAYSIRKEQRAQGVPPHWMIYISVENADQSVARAAQAGGTVLSPAFDVMDSGRMAVIQDPTGAIFSLWEPKRSPRIATSGNNAFCWADLSTPNPERASRFYAELFGWQMMKDEKDPSGYIHIKNGETFIGGIPPAHRNPNAPPHWLIYFQMAEVEAATLKAGQLGGKVLMPARTMENVGTLSIVADPQGAAFSLFKSAR